MSLVQFLFSFEGRVRRLHLWAFFLVLGFMYGGLFWQFGTFHVAHGETNYGPGSFTWSALVSNPIVDIFGIVAIWMKLAVLVKRWHDRGKSGWWVLISILPVIGWIWQFVECALLDGTPGSNKYGPSPKAIGAPAGAF